MKRHLMPKWFFYPLSFLFIGLAFCGVCLTWQAQVENYQVGLAVDQVLRVVAQAREMRLTQKENAYVLQNELIQKMVSQEEMQSQLISVSQDNLPEYALVNPWGDSLRVMVSPERKELRLLLSANFQHCRRVLSFFATDARGVGITRVDVMSDPAFNLWRLVYDGRVKGAKGIEKEKIHVNCGHGEDVAISLIFRLP